VRGVLVGRSTFTLLHQSKFWRYNPPSFWAVIDEGVLRRRIGSAKVMQDQLAHLAEMSERPLIKVHVIPAEVGAHIGLLGAFAIAGFADDAPGAPERTRVLVTSYQLAAAMTTDARL
jgi:hypothetical protein